MKKQILILILAIFAVGLSSNAYGQWARTIDCLSPDALHPIAGTPYAYTIDVPTPNPGTAWTDVNYRWFVTQSTSFINAGNFNAVVSGDGSFFNVTAGSGYNLLTGGTNTITIVWESAGYDPALPVFVGILVEGENGTCSPNNLKIYRIQPLHAFTLDIANVQGGTILSSDYGTNIDNCIADIVSATYDAVNEEIDYQYGENVFVYAVIAANWANGYQLSAQLSNVDANQTATLEWSYDPAFPAAGTYPIGVGNGTHVAANHITPQGGNSYVGTDGEVIYIRLTIEHGTQFEGIADIQYVLAVNGQLSDGSTLIANMFDVHHECNGNTPPEPVMADFDDIAYQTLKARPNVVDQTPPAGDDFLPIGTP